MNKKEEIQKYTEVYDNLKAPEQWKTDLKALMREELAKNEDHAGDKEDVQRKPFDVQSKRRLPKGYKKILMAGAIAASFLLVCTVKMMDGPRFITPMKDDVVQSEVVLKDANLYFEIQKDEQDTGIWAGKDDGNQTPVTFEIDEETGEIVTSKKPCGGNSKPSYIKGIPVYLTITITDEGYRYTAIYEKKGEMIEITRSGMTQKDFIEILYREIKKR